MVRRATVGRDAGVCHADDAAGGPRPTFGRPMVGEGERHASSRGRDHALVFTNAVLGRSRVAIGATGRGVGGGITRSYAAAVTWCARAATSPHARPSQYVAMAAEAHAEATDVGPMLSWSRAGSPSHATRASLRDQRRLRIVADRRGAAEWRPARAACRDRAGRGERCAADAHVLRSNGLVSAATIAGSDTIPGQLDLIPVHRSGRPTTA